MLYEFIALHRDDIVTRTRDRISRPAVAVDLTP